MANLKSESQNADFEDEQPKKINNRSHYEGPQTRFAELFYLGLCTYAHKKDWDLGPARAYLEQLFGISVRKLERLQQRKQLKDCELLIKIVKEFVTTPKQESDSLSGGIDTSSRKKSRPRPFINLNKNWVKELFEATIECKEEADRAVKEIFGIEEFLWSNPKIQGVDLTKTYVKREAQLIEWRERLCTDKENPKPLIMRGMGGTGKTTLVKTLLQDPIVRTHFRHGFLWAEMGPYEQEKLNEKVSSYLQNWCLLLEIKLDSGEEKNLDRLVSKLGEKIKSDELRLLVIIDDVWGWSDVAETLLLDGVPAILTTREKGLPQKLDLGPKQLVELGEMSDEEALSLIRNKFEDLNEEKWDEKWEVNARQFAKLVGNLPLALDLGVGIVVWEKDGWNYLLQGLQKPKGVVKTLRKSDSDHRQHSLEIMLDLSYKRLSREAQQLLVHLSVFVPNKAFAKDSMNLIYVLGSLQILFGSEESIWKQAFKELVDKSLLLNKKSKNEEYYLHKAVVDYAELQKEKQKDSIDVDIHFIFMQRYCLVPMTYNPPREQALLMKEEWPEVVRAWSKIVELGSHLRSRITDLSRLTYEFSEMGCNILGRQQRWDDISQWTEKARQIIEADIAQMGNRPYLEGLTIWQIDALLQKGQAGEAMKLLSKRAANSRVVSHPWWQWRYEIRRVRCLLAQENLNELETAITGLRNVLTKIKDIHRSESHQISALRELEDYYAQYEQQVDDNQAVMASIFSPSYSSRKNLEELAILEAELHWILGDYEAKRGVNPRRAEFEWFYAAKYVSGSSFKYQTPCFVTDMWWFEKLTEQALKLLDSYEEWDRGIVLGQRWIELRRILGLPIGDALTLIAQWVALRGQPKFINWASIQLELLKKTQDEQQPEAEVVEALQEGLQLAEQGDRDTVEQRLRLVLKAIKPIHKYPPSRYSLIQFPIEDDCGEIFEERVALLLDNTDWIATDEEGKCFRGRMGLAIPHPKNYWDSYKRTHN